MKEITPENQAIRKAFMEAVPSLLSDESIFGTNTTIIQIRSKDFVIAAVDFEKDTSVISYYSYDGVAFESLDSCLQKKAFQDGLLQPDRILPAK